MSKIQSIKAREILDSRGNPTIEAEVILEDGTKTLAQVPSGASTGSNEVRELRDNDSSRYLGKGVLKAVENIKGPIKEVLIGQDADDQEKIDQLMIKADGTENKSNLGGNALVGVSMAVCRAAAKSQKIPLYQYFGQLMGNDNFVLPQPQILILEGGKHGNWSTDIQEYMIVPKKESFSSFREMLRAGAEIFHSLEKILKKKNYATGVGYEGAFMPKEIKSNEEAFQLMIEAVEEAGYHLPDQIVLATDGASSEFFEEGNYILKSENHQKLTSRQWSQKIINWSKQYPIWSFEDMHAEEDWDEWIYLTTQVGNKIQVVGDDLLTTNTKMIQKAIDLKAVNSVLIKLNQIGTVTETLEAIKLADSAGLPTIISHRGGETNDDLIADLVVGTTSWQCKFGGPDRGERLAKYNRLLEIEEELNHENTRSLNHKNMKS
ncbi:phosphopyruvate hydratase [Candidatus Microgenomates bacterium]|nr:phosphopyruvate hydratase [Candidatus Microgenomates bacterium]